MEKDACFINKDQSYTRNSLVQVRDEAYNNYLLFHSGTFETLIVNETGKYIWESCDGLKTVADIAIDIKNNFEIEKSQEDIQKIVMDYIKLLEFKNLLE